MSEVEARAKVVDTNGYTLVKKTHLFLSLIIIMVMMAVQVALFVYDRAENNAFKQEMKSRVGILEGDSYSRTFILLEMRFNTINYFKANGFNYIENPPDLRK